MVHIHKRGEGTRASAPLQLGCGWGVLDSSSTPSFSQNTGGLSRFVRLLCVPCGEGISALDTLWTRDLLCLFLSQNAISALALLNSTERHEVHTWENRDHTEGLLLPPPPLLRVRPTKHLDLSRQAPCQKSPCEDFVDAWIAPEEGVACFGSRGLRSLYLLELSAAPA